MDSRFDFIFGSLNLANTSRRLKWVEGNVQRLDSSHLQWLTWLNLDSMVSDENLHGKSLEGFEEMLEQSHGLPSTPERLTLEFSVLYKLGCEILHQGVSVFVESWWILTHLTLRRAFCLIMKTNPTLKDPNPENCLSLIQVILSKIQSLKNDHLYEPFLLLCCATCWLLLYSGAAEKSRNLSTTLSELDSNKESSDERVTTVPNLQEVIYLTAALSSHANPKEALELMNRIRCTPWQHVVTYFKVSLLRDASKYDEALQLAAPLAQEQYKDLEKRLRPRLCALIGSCLSQSGMRNLAIDWFRKALTEEPTWLIPLWYICNEYFALRKPAPECSALKLMARASKSTEKGPRNITENGTKSQLRFEEALYILASRLHHSGSHQEAYEYYKDLLGLVSSGQESEWILVTRPSLSQVYLQAADAALRSEHFQQCLELCNTLLSNHPENEKESPGLFDDSPESSEGNVSHHELQRRNISRFTSASASVIKAVACMHLGNEGEAASIFRSVLSVATSIDSDERDEDPFAKRRKLDTHNNNNEVDETDLAQWQRLISQCHCNLSVLRLKRGLKKDALHSLRVALLSWPDNLDALFNYTTLLVQVSEKREAQATWQKAKDQTLSISLQQDDPYWTFNVTQEALRNLDGLLTTESV